MTAATTLTKKVVHPDRHQLPDSRESITLRRDICGYKVYFTVSFFNAHQEDLLKPAEVFVKVAKHGSMIGGLLDGFCSVLSTSLQYGVPWDALKKKLLHHIFERNGDPQHTSLLDGFAKAVDFLIEQRRTAIFGDEPARAAAATVGPTDPEGPEEPPATSSVGVSPRAPQGTGGATAETPVIDVRDIPRMTANPRMEAGVPMFDDVRPKHGFGGGPYVTKVVEDRGPGLKREWAIYEDGSDYVRVTTPHGWQGEPATREFWFNHSSGKCFNMDGSDFDPGTLPKEAVGQVKS